MDYEQALKIATEAHKGQKRWNGDDYITHPIRVADSFTDDEMKTIAVLHDVVEDTDITIDELSKICDVTIISTLLYLTKDKDYPYAEYIMKIKTMSKLATKIKIADLLDNLFDLKKGQRKDKYELALKILIGE